MTSGEFKREETLVEGNGFSLSQEVGMSETLAKEGLNGETENGLKSNTSFLNGDGDGISLVVDVNDSAAIVNENGGEKITEIIASISNEGEMQGIIGDEMNAENEGEEDNEDVGDENHEYLVGDFVWGKIRSHPWWPGQIYDPSDASVYAAKYKQKDRLLVAYFGDGSFSWCSPSQLKPFVENYVEMSKQSNSKAFVNAMEKALDEISRLVELEMSCKCIPERSQMEVAKTVNGGIRAGVVVPKGNIGKQLVDLHEPEKLLASVRYFARVISVNILEFIVLKNWLTAYYRAKGGYGLPIYPEPKCIEGLEDKNKRVLEITDFSEPVEVPIQAPFEEDWLSSPLTFSQKGPEISGDKLYQRRKKKSVAELMSDEMEVEPKDKKGSVVKGSQSGKSVSEKKKRKVNDETESQISGILTPTSEGKRGRKKKVEVSIVENGGVEGEEANENPLLSRKKRSKISSVENDDIVPKEEKRKTSASPHGKKRNEVSGIESDDDGEKEETLTSFASRERKKSRYLSSPYTDPSWKTSNPIPKRDFEAESEKISKITKMGERMTRAAGQLIGSPTVLKSGDKTVKEKGHEESETAKQDHKKKLNPIEVNANLNEVLAEIQSAAFDPLHMREKNYLDMVTGFIHSFRESIFLNGSNYKTYHKGQPGRKRKSMNDSNEIDTELDEPLPKLKKHVKEAEKKASSPVALVLTFPPGFSLPAKKDLIKIFSKFGNINETETDVFYNSYCARIVFVKSSDAEEAFNVSIIKSPFGDANVNFRLRYSAGSRPGGTDPKEPKLSPKKPRDDASSPLSFVRQKLEMITSMLENSGGRISAQMKSKLQGEMKGLLEKVCEMESTSS